VTGVGLDLLEIDRLAHALARRPQLAERLFTEGERAFAAERAAELGVEVTISLTHSRGMAGAVAMLR
jgi:phosphopantetheinyl transferase (holo-ACP synthase)